MGLTAKNKSHATFFCSFMRNRLIPRLGLTCPDDPLPEAVLYVVYSLYAVSLIMFLTIGTVEREYVEIDINHFTLKKRLAIFPSPAGMSLTKLSLAGNNLILPGQEEFGN
jgi:hypothetical protein